MGAEVHHWRTASWNSSFARKVLQALAQGCQRSWLPGVLQNRFSVDECGHAQGVVAAKNAWKKKNVQPATKKDEKKARPTGRGDGGPQQQRGGRQGMVLEIWLHMRRPQQSRSGMGNMGGCHVTQRMPVHHLAS